MDSTVARLNIPLILAGNLPKTLGELFNRPDRWTKGADGKNADGNSVGARNPHAIRWCVGGALQLVYGSETSDNHEQAVQKVLKYIRANMTNIEDPDSSVSEWNDRKERTFKDVRKMIKQTGV